MAYILLFLLIFRQKEGHISLNRLFDFYDSVEYVMISWTGCIANIILYALLVGLNIWL